MADAFTQLYIHIVIVIKHREAQISPIWEDELYKYITGIVQSKGQKMIAINGMPDHLHILIGLTPECILSGLVREIKKSSNSFINRHKLTKERFYWQAGYGAFSYSHSQLGRVVNYINRQKEHHKKKDLKDEYIQLLDGFEIEFKQQHLFTWIN